MDLSSFKDYEDIKSNFHWNIPESYNIAARCLDTWADDKGRVAMFYEDENGYRETLTFWQLKRQSNQLANLLSTLGIGAGDRVGLVLPQCPETARAHLALYKLGAIAVPMSMLYGPDSYQYIMQDCEMKAIIADESKADSVRHVQGEVSTLEHCIIRGMAGPKEISLQEAEQLSTEYQSYPTKASDPALLLYTSGTTGHPKGALHAQHILEGYLLTVRLFYNLDFDSTTVFWTPSDWAWVGGLLDVLLPALAWGKPTLAYHGRFSTQKAYQLMSHYGVTHVFLAPTALKMLAQVANPKTHYDLDLRVIASGGESVADEVLKWSEEALGAVCNEFYGLTEVNHLAGSCARLWPVKAGSMGKAYPGRDVDIINERGRSVTAGELGQIVVRPGDPTQMLGYWNNPGATAEKLHNGWLLTGDMAYRDEEGYIYFKGRNDDMIGSSGYRIGPAEVEEALMRHPAIAEAAVVGSPDPMRGQIVKAFIELAKGFEASETLKHDIQDFVKSNLAAYKYPREISFVAALPKTTTSKLNRKHLREQEQANQDQFSQSHKNQDQKASS